MRTQIAGIPCTIGEIEVIGEYVPARIHADPDDCYEAQYPEVMYVIQDRRGRPAPWLERKMTDKDRRRIESEVLEAEAERACD